MSPQTIISDKKAYTYIGMYSAVLYSVLLVAPVIASALATQYSLEPTSIGLMAAIELGCFSLATVPAYLWLRRANVRWVTLGCTLLVIAGNIASAMAPSFDVLLVFRAITALSAGSITVIILSLSAKTSNPSRAYGIFVVTQLAMGAAILLVFPALFAGRPVAAVYITLAVLVALCLPAVWCLKGDEFKKSSVVERASNRIPAAKVLAFTAALVAVFGFYVALGGVWTFMGEIAQGGGVSLEDASSALGIATVVGAVVALVASIVGESKRVNFFILTGYVAMGASMALLYGGPGLIRFAISAIVFKIAWSWLLPFLLSVVSKVGGAHVMSSTNLVIGTGLGVSPLLAGQIIQLTGGFSMMISVSLVVLGVAVLASIVVMRSQNQATVTVGSHVEAA